MSRPNASKKASGKSTKVTGWDRAIADARELLDRVEQKATRLRSAIRTFQQSKEAGEPYVATQSSDHTSGEQHAI